MRCKFVSNFIDLYSMDEVVATSCAIIQRDGFVHCADVNVATIVNSTKNEQLRNAINSADLINIDGMGVVWGARLCGLEVPERVAGVDLFLELLAMAAREGFPVYFLGAREAVVDTVARRMQERFPGLQLAGWHHGYFWDDEAAVVQAIRESGAKLLFVAISSPKKENFIHAWKEQLGVRFVMGVGGTFDVIAGRTRRAPKWMQRIGLEWFYRLCQEPRRMWKRYLVTNSVYAWLLVKEFFGARRDEGTERRRDEEHKRDEKTKGTNRRRD